MATLKTWRNVVIHHVESKPLAGLPPAGSCRSLQSLLLNEAVWNKKVVSLCLGFSAAAVQFFS